MWRIQIWGQILLFINLHWTAVVFRSEHRKNRRNMHPAKRQYSMQNHSASHVLAVTDTILKFEVKCESFVQPCMQWLSKTWVVEKSTKTRSEPEPESGDIAEIAPFRWQIRNRRHRLPLWHIWSVIKFYHDIVPTIQNVMCVFLQKNTDRANFWRPSLMQFFA